MDKIDKALEKLNSKTKERIRNIIKALQSGRFNNLNIKKLKGGGDIFRVREGQMRIIYQVRDGRTFILKVGFRKEDTYKL